MLSHRSLLWRGSRDKPDAASSAQRRRFSPFSLILLLATVGFGTSVALSPLVTLESELRELEGHGIEVRDLLRDQFGRRATNRTPLRDTALTRRQPRHHFDSSPAPRNDRPELTGSGIRILC